ncbi:MAG: hypothetical protein R2911_22220 [Caldilineaceae bacterium]
MSVQAAVLNLLLEIQREYNSTLLFIAHDLSVVRFFSDYIAVMYPGRNCGNWPRRRHLRPALSPVHRSAALSSAHPPTPMPNRSTSACAVRCHYPTRPAAAASTPAAAPPEIAARRRQNLHGARSPRQQSHTGHRIYCHIPVEQLAEFDPVITTVAAYEAVCCVR